MDNDEKAALAMSLFFILQIVLMIGWFAGCIAGWFFLFKFIISLWS